MLVFQPRVTSFLLGPTDKNSLERINHIIKAIYSFAVIVVIKQVTQVYEFEY